MGNKQASIPTRRLLPNDSVLPAPCSMLNSAVAVFLRKLAKHLALLACLLILSEASGRLTIGPVTIFFLTVFASAADLAGRTLSRRLPDRVSKIPS